MIKNAKVYECDICGRKETVEEGCEPKDMITFKIYDLNACICKRCFNLAVNSSGINLIVTEFADKCKECGAIYGKLLKQKKEEELYFMDLLNMIKKLSEENNCEISLCFDARASAHRNLKLEVLDEMCKINRFILYDVLESNSENWGDILKFNLEEMIGELRQEDTQNEEM